MKKLGRPKKADEDKVKNHIISIDYEDYTKIRDYCLKNNIMIKTLISELIADLQYGIIFFR